MLKFSCPRIVLSSLIALAALGFVLAPRPSVSSAYAQSSCDCGYEVTDYFEECVPGAVLWATCDPEWFEAETFEAEITLCAANFPQSLPATIQAHLVLQTTNGAHKVYLGTFTLSRVGVSDRYEGSAFLPHFGVCHPAGNDFQVGVEFDSRLASGFWFNEEALLRVVCNSELCY